MYVATIQCLQRTRIQNMQFAIDISDTPVTLKQSQGHQIYNQNVDPKQGYNHAKFERPCCKYDVWEKANAKVFSFSNKEIGQLSPLKMCTNKQIVIYSWSTWCNQQLYNILT